MQIIPLVLSTAAAVAVQHKVAIRPFGSEEVVDYALLSLKADQNGVFDYSPASTQPAPEQGCIGIIGESGFVCQSQYKKDPNSPYERNAVRAYIGPNASISQVQLVEGSRDEIQFEVPEVVPKPMVSGIKSPKVSRKGSNKATNPQKKNYKNNKDTVEETSEETPQPESLLEKYWIYLIPIGVLLLTQTLSKGT